MLCDSDVMFYYDGMSEAVSDYHYVMAAGPGRWDVGMVGWSHRNEVSRCLGSDADMALAMLCALYYITMHMLMRDMAHFHRITTHTLDHNHCITTKLKYN